MKQRYYCFTLEKFSLMRAYFAIIDTAEYLADNLFIKHQVRVKFGPEYFPPDGKYRVIFCSCRKKDQTAFLNAIDELPNKMLLCGHTDYSDFCKNLLNDLRTVKEEMEAMIYAEGGSAEEAEQAGTEGIS